MWLKNCCIRDVFSEILPTLPLETLEGDALRPLYVAKPLIPPLEELNALLQTVWTSGTFTNQGPLHNQLEEELAGLLKVPVAKLFCNGTTALQCALLSLDLPKGSEVITTPLTFPATAHAITASGLKPVFADIDEDSLTIDPKAVELAITSNTSAVIGVHVYGSLCDHALLQSICEVNNLKLLYDAAHAFGSSINSQSVATLGDMAIFSLHATKLFNTIEGGLVTSTKFEHEHILMQSRNFGIQNEEVVASVGINGKMSELNAAIGLLNLKQFNDERQKRSELRTAYDQVLRGFPGLTTQLVQQGVKQSEQYYPILIDPSIFGATRDHVYKKLKEFEIYSRRYFWPICTDFKCYRGSVIYSVHKTPIVEMIKDRVLCLPFHSGVSRSHINKIEQVLDSIYNRREL